MSNNFSVRRAGIEDTGEVCELLFALKGMYGSSAEKNLPDFRLRYEASILEAINNPANAVWIAVDDASQSLGFMSTTVRLVLRLGGLVGSVEEVFVRPECRRRGIGTDLWLVASGDLRSQGVSIVEWVSSLAHPGQRPYAKKIGLEWYASIHRISL